MGGGVSVWSQDEAIANVKDKEKAKARKRYDKKFIINFASDHWCEANTMDVVKGQDGAITKVNFEDF